MNTFNNEIERHYKEWQRLCHELLPAHKDLADDLLHDTLMKILESDADKMDDIIKRGKIHAYVTSALRLAAYSSKSSFNYSFMKFSRLAVELTGDITDDLSSVIAQRLEKEQLDIFISRLPFFERELLFLYALDGFSYGQLSKETGIPKPYLYQTIKNAKKILRKSVIR
jgi:RNA polymerase sigma factor (sigma-70 family)